MTVPRLTRRAVLDPAAEKAGWGQLPASARHRGPAVHETVGAVVAEVAEVAVPLRL